MAGDEKLELLRTVPLFASCDAREIERLGQLVEEVDLPAGKVVFREGDSAQEMFLVVSGRLRAERGGQPVLELGPGDMAGEMSMVAGGPRMATLTTVTNCRVLVLGHRDFHSLMDEFPSLRTRVLESLASKVRILDTAAVH